MNLPEFSIRKPVSVIVAMLIFITIGVISITKLPLEMMPDTSFPGLMVQVPYPSSSPEEVERTITRPLEDVLATVDHLDSFNSTSSASSSMIHMQFKGGTNMDLAAMQIRDKIDIMRGQLPDDIENIRIRRFSMNDRPVINFSLSLPGDLENLYLWSENYILQQLERIEGVANVDISGIRNKVLTVYLKPEVFYSSSIRITDLIDTIRNNNINISAGYIEDASMRYAARIPGELKVVDEVKNLPVNRQGLTIADVARVTYDYPPKERFDRLNGNETVRFQIYRASNANIVDVCSAVKRTMAEIKESEPELEGMNVIFYRDQSEDILKSLRDLAISGIAGGLLAVVVLLFFLRKFRSTVIIAIAIPMAMVVTFSFMYLYRQIFRADITINIISLSGLMMAVGMLVDNSVVVLENIFRLRQEKKMGAMAAARQGAGDVAMAISASTLTTLVVFVSLGFMSGSGFGRFMGDFALTISLALLASFIVALTFIPLASSRLLTGKAKEKAVWLVKLTHVYERVIRFTIKNWKTKLAIVVLAAGIVFISFQILGSIEQEFMAQSDEREVNISVYMPSTFTLEEMQALFRGYERMFMDRKEELAIEYVTTSFGINRMRQGRYQGRIELALLETGPDVTEIKERLKDLLPVRAGVEYEYAQRFGRGGHARGISVELIGIDYTTLTELAPLVMERLSTIDLVEDITSDLEGGDIQLTVEVDRQKSESTGLGSRMVAQTVSSSLSERPIGKFKTENREIDIILKVQSDKGFGVDDLRNLSIPAMDQRIPLSAVADISYGVGSTSIRKEDKKSKLRININTKSGGMMAISDSIEKVMSSISLPEGYSWSLGGGWRRFQQSQEESFMAIILALIFIYIIMASLFESFVHPFTIILTVPLALFGVALFFKTAGITLNTTSYLGLLVLFGIVVNNGIILIDHIRKLRNSGTEKIEAIVQGGKDRMRPIIMTAITTIFGVLPLALPFLLPEVFPAAGRRSMMWAPISVAIIGGLTTSTFFTLIFLPTFYAIAETVTTSVKSFFKFKTDRV